MQATYLSFRRLVLVLRASPSAMPVCSPRLLLYKLQDEWHWTGHQHSKDLGPTETIRNWVPRHLPEVLEAGVDLNGLSDCSAAYIAEAGVLQAAEKREMYLMSHQHSKDLNP